ncbi:hypothetical protein K8T06_11895 [bacterium]|nr:hypothetical protein [bacterium]
MPPEQLVTILEKHFRIDATGKSFGVLKLRDTPIDISIPRSESKAGLGHKGFLINSDPSLSPEKAARRRDFTINAMAYDLINDQLIDPYNGKKDLDDKILRHTSSQFVEDPLRVLRGMQFIARFNLDPAVETTKLCKTIGLEGLSRERIFGEWKN